MDWLIYGFGALVLIALALIALLVTVLALFGANKR